jgi:SAM-dependent methyltransferase
MPTKILPYTDVRYLTSVINLYSEIQSVPGHILELGVGGGGNSILFGNLIRLFGDDGTRQYLGFDTFKGYLARDLKIQNYLSKERWLDAEYSLNNVRNLVADHNLSEQCEFFEGDIVESLPTVMNNHRGLRFSPGGCLVALLYVDCNAFKPSEFAMEFLWDRITPGGIIAVDERMQGGESSALLKFSYKVGLQIETSPRMPPMFLRKPKL